MQCISLWRFLQAHEQRQCTITVHCGGRRCPCSMPSQHGVRLIVAPPEGCALIVVNAETSA
eukprot:1159398-Pelagomonas_calceolata.AAC.4